MSCDSSEIDRSMQIVIRTAWIRQHSYSLSREIHPLRSTDAPLHPSHPAICFFLGFKSKARGSRRNKQPSPMLVRLPDKFGVTFHQLTAEEGRSHSFQPWHISFDRLHAPSFRPSDTKKTKMHTLEKKEHPHSEEGTKCSNCSRKPTGSGNKLVT